MPVIATFISASIIIYYLIGRMENHCKSRDRGAIVYLPSSPSPIMLFTITLM